jgi:hypothetical protein
MPGFGQVADVQGCDWTIEQTVLGPGGWVLACVPAGPARPTLCQVQQAALVLVARHKPRPAVFSVVRVRPGGIDPVLGPAFLNYHCLTGTVLYCADTLIDRRTAWALEDVVGEVFSGCLSPGPGSPPLTLRVARAEHRVLWPSLDPVGLTGHRSDAALTVWLCEERFTDDGFVAALDMLVGAQASCLIEACQAS